MLPACLQAADRAISKQDKAAGTESAKQADTKNEGEKGSQEEKELTGTIDDIKDFMFVVTDDQGYTIQLYLR